MSEDPVVLAVENAISIYQEIESPSVSDINNLVNIIISAIEDGDITSANFNDIVTPLLDLLFDNGLTDADYYSFYQNLYNNTDSETSIEELQALLFSYVLDVLSDSSETSNVISSTTLYLNQNFSSLLYTSLNAYVSNSNYGLSAYTAQFMTTFPTMLDYETSGDFAIGYSQETLTTWLAEFTEYLVEEGVDETVIEDFEEKFLLTLSVIQAANFNSFLTSIYTSDNAGVIRNYYESKYWSEFSQRNETGITDYINANKLSTDDITGQSFLAAVESFLDSSSLSDAQISFTEDYFRDTFRLYQDPADSNGAESLISAYYGRSLTAAYPSSSSYSTTATSNFGIWSLYITYSEAADVISDINDAIADSLSESDLEESFDLSTLFTSYYENLGIPDYVTYSDLTEFKESLIADTTVSWPSGFTSDDFDTIFTNNLSSSYLDNVSEMLSYTLSGDDLSTTLSNIQSSISVSVTDESVGFFAQTVWQALVFDYQNGLVVEGMNVLTFIQVGLEMLEYLSNFEDQDVLDSIGSVLNQTINTSFLSSGTSISGSVAETTTSIQSQMSLIEQLSIVLGVAFAIISLGLIEVFAAVASALVGVEIAATATTAAVETTNVTVFTEAAAPIVSAAMTSSDLTTTAVSTAIVSISQTLEDSALDGIVEVLSSTTAGDVATDVAAGAIAEVADELGVDVTILTNALTDAVANAAATEISSTALTEAASSLISYTAQTALYSVAAEAGISNAAVAAGVNAVVTAGVDISTDAGAEIAFASVATVAADASVPASLLLDAVSDSIVSILEAGVEQSLISGAMTSLIESAAGISSSALTSALSASVTSTITTELLSTALTSVINESGVSSLTGSLDAAAEEAVTSIAESAGVDSQTLIDAVNTVGLTVSDITGESFSSFSLTTVYESVLSSGLESAATISSEFVSTTIADAAGDLSLSSVTQAVKLSLAFLGPSGFTSTIDGDTFVALSSVVAAVGEEAGEDGLMVAVSSIITTIGDSLGDSVVEYALEQVILEACNDTLSELAGISAEGLSSIISLSAESFDISGDVLAEALNVVAASTEDIEEGVSSSLFVSLADETGIDAETIKSAVEDVLDTVELFVGDDADEYALDKVTQEALESAVQEAQNVSAQQAAAELAQTLSEEVGAQVTESTLSEATQETLTNITDSIGDIAVDESNDAITSTVNQINSVVSNVSMNTTDSLTQAWSGIKEASELLVSASSEEGVDFTNIRSLGVYIRSLYDLVSSSTTDDLSLLLDISSEYSSMLETIGLPSSQDLVDNVLTPISDIFTETTSAEIQSAATNITTIVTDLGSDVSSDTISDAMSQFQEATETLTTVLEADNANSEALDVASVLDTVYQMLQDTGEDISEELTEAYENMLDTIEGDVEEPETPLEPEEDIVEEPDSDEILDDSDEEDIIEDSDSENTGNDADEEDSSYMDSDEELDSDEEVVISDDEDEQAEMQAIMDSLSVENVDGTTDIDTDIAAEEEDVVVDENSEDDGYEGDEEDGDEDLDDNVDQDESEAEGEDSDESLEGSEEATSETLLISQDGISELSGSFQSVQDQYVTLTASTDGAYSSTTVTSNLESMNTVTNEFLDELQEYDTAYKGYVADVASSFVTSTQDSMSEWYTGLSKVLEIVGSDSETMQSLQAAIDEIGSILESWEPVADEGVEGIETDVYNTLEEGLDSIQTLYQSFTQTVEEGSLQGLEQTINNLTIEVNDTLNNLSSLIVQYTISPNTMTEEAVEYLSESLTQISEVQESLGSVSGLDVELTSDVTSMIEANTSSVNSFSETVEGFSDQFADSVEEEVSEEEVIDDASLDSDANSMVTVDEDEIAPGSVEGLDLSTTESIDVSITNISDQMTSLNSLLESGTEGAESAVDEVLSSINDAVSALQSAIDNLESTEVTQETVDYLSTQVDLVSQTQSELTSLITGNSLNVSADGLTMISANESALSTLSESVGELTPYIEDPVSTSEIVTGTTLGAGATTFGVVEGIESEDDLDESDDDSDEEEVNT